MAADLETFLQEEVGANAAEEEEEAPRLGFRALGLGFKIVILVVVLI